MRQQSVFDQYSLQRLKVSISEKAGFIIVSKSDCALLSDRLYQQDFGYISVSTLFRIFFQPEKHLPYKSTLDILCRFCGYADSTDFLDKLSSVQTISQHREISLSAQQPQTSLLYTCIENKALAPLNNYFEMLDEQSVEIKEATSIHLFDVMLRSSRQDFFFKNFVDNKYVKEFFFEKAHDPKFRIRHYDKAYLIYIQKLNSDWESEQMQDHLFAYSVLFRYYFLNHQFAKAETIGKSIYRDDFKIDKYSKHLNLFPYMRFVSYKLWYMQMRRLSQTVIEDYANSILQLCEKLKMTIPVTEHKILFHTVAETFIHSSLPVLYHKQLKKIFFQQNRNLPPSLLQKHLKNALPYFEPNGLIYHRP